MAPRSSYYANPSDQFVISSPPRAHTKFSSNSSIAVHGNDCSPQCASAPQQQQHQQQHSPRRVAFALEETVINEIPNRDDFTSAEKSQSWYSKQELESIRRDIRALVSRLQAGETISASEACIRGIEARIMPTAQKKIRNALKEQCIKLVLEEQGRQWDSFECDADAIAKVSTRITQQCQSIAFRLGRADFRESRRR
uniref:Uncharacterized protein n=1 Tax=Craspedostauros australis TaxID=1486917 RepID=A0A7R9WRD7_9STRA|eukprot:CAMPEP_0198111960 /NCGR_PEP_ID=MMETSP1442-20131203/3873_1 /TAXON_ID= /ORGANISM="Craspedostauros australis, Strain CCMP3328" /LENGTH=196 /DNA_ID=CAMNT_0043768573 /DNA_START=45 /DNA_END=635 /DNA_ORIENTATION=+